MSEWHIDDIGVIKTGDIGVVINVGYGDLGMTAPEARSLAMALLDAADEQDGLASCM